MVHYGSHEDYNLLDVFNEKLYREFYSNKDYELLGGHDSPKSGAGDQDSEEATKETKAL